jgi:hypothetical protein
MDWITTCGNAVGHYDCLHVHHLVLAIYLNVLQGEGMTEDPAIKRGNRTTVCAFVRSLKKAKFTWYNPFKRTSDTNTNNALDQMGSKTDQVIPGSQSKTMQNIQETLVVPLDDEDNVMSDVDVPGTSTCPTTENVQVGKRLAI